MFPKELVHGFGKKKNWNFYHVLIFGKINQQNVFDIILESQKAFSDYKKQKVKKVEESGFFQRGLVHGFGKKKLKFLPCSYFWQDQPAKCVWHYSRKSKSIFRL